MANRIFIATVTLLLTAVTVAQNTSSNTRPRALDLGLKVGILPTGTLDSITDVAGVEVGHTTIIRGDDARTGVTVLVQTNFGGVLTIAGAPVGRELGRYYLREELQQAGGATDRGNGSVMVVVATDASVDARNLKRMAARAMLGLGRTGAAGSNGSGDYAIAFSTSPEVRIRSQDKGLTRHVEVLTNDAMSPLFLAVIQATEEAVYNSLFRATTVTGRGYTVEALPIVETLEILRKYGAIK